MYVPDPGQEVRNGHGRARGVRTNLFDRELPFRESHTEAEVENTPARTPQKQE